MSLLPVYYTSLNFKKLKKKKSVRQLKAEQEHQAYIDRMKRNSVSGSTTASKPVRVGSIPTSFASGHRIRANTPAFQAENESSNLSARSIAPCSDVIPTGVAYKKTYTDHNFTIAPAYNKGSYQVISRKDVKDIGK